MKVMLFVLNPNAGTKKANRYLAEILATFNQADYTVVTVVTIEPTLKILCIVSLDLNLYKIYGIWNFYGHSIKTCTVRLVILYKIRKIITVTFRILLCKCSSQFV